MEKIITKMSKIVDEIKEDLEKIQIKKDSKNYEIKALIFDVLYGLFVGFAALFLHHM